MSDLLPWLPTILTFLPAAAALGLTAVRSDKAAKSAALGVSLLVLAGAVAMCVAFDPAGPAMQFTLGEDGKGFEWIRALHIRYATGVDGIALSMIALTAILCPLCLLCSWEAIHDRAKSFTVAFLLLEASMIGVFCAADLFLFYVFWEAMLIPMVLIIGIWGGPRRVYAAVKFFIFTMVGSLAMLLAVLYCYGKAETFNIADLQATLPGRIELKAQLWLFLAFGLAFAIKVPLFPFHTWLPDAHVEAPTAGSVILAGVLLKMGVYGFLRLAMPFFPLAAVELAGPIVALSLVSIVFGALMSMAQSDIKKLIAYSSVSHLGFCMLGLFTFTVAGTQGAVLQMVNHGVSTGALFLLVGIIYERAHKRGTDDFGGLAKVMPAYATVFMIITLSSIGLPGLNGFVGEFLVLAGAFASSKPAGVIAATGVVLGAMYMLKLYRDVFFGKVTAPKHEKLPDANTRELVTLAPLLALVVLLGIVPSLVLDRTEPAVKRVVEAVRRAQPVEAHVKP